MSKRTTPGLKPRPARPKRALILVALLLVLFLVGLDYLGWIKGGRSFVFPLVLGQHLAPDATQFYRLIIDQMAGFGIKRRAVSGFTDRDDVFHVKVDLPLERYQALAGPLERSLTGSGARILNQEASQDKDLVYYLWTIEGRRKERIALLFSCSLPDKDRKRDEEAPPAWTEVQPGTPKLVAIVIDDLGNSLDAARDVCALGLPVTVAVLPRSPHGTETAQLAHECGLEVILHMPMESLGNHRTEQSTPGMIYTEMSDEDIRRTAEDDLGQIPYIRGVNNHMGSRTTQEERPLVLILNALKGKNLYFIDSRTNPRSLACDVARTLGIPAAASSLFIDPGDDPSLLTPEMIKARVMELVALARKNGQAIGIGHPRPMTLNALRECLPLFQNADVSFVFASKLAK